MRTTQIVSLAFALAGYSMAAPAPQEASAAIPTASASGSSGSDGPLLPGREYTHYCEDPSNYAFQDMDVQVTPEMPTPGSNMTVSITGTLKSAITDGTQQRVTFGKIQDGEEKVLFTNSRDVCAGLGMIPDALNPKTCPIEAGPFEWSHSFQIPSLPSSFDISNIDPEKIEEARERMETMAAEMRAKAQENVPEGEFFFRGQTISAEGEVLSCIYADLNPSEMLENAAGAGNSTAAA